MLEAKNIKYRVSRSFSLSDINISVPEGYLTCLLGKNGAGKSTLMNVLYGCLIPQGGTVSFGGEEIIRRGRKSSHLNRMTSFHRDAAFIADMKWCVGKMSIDENVSFLRCMYESFDDEEFERIMNVFEFGEGDRKKKYDLLSTGQKMQFQIAFHMARHPKLYLMDEPLANLDPVIKEDILELVRSKISGENASVLMSTHLVEEISDMVDYIGIMENGKMKAFGNRDEISEEFGAESIRELVKGEH